MIINFALLLSRKEANETLKTFFSIILYIFPLHLEQFREMIRYGSRRNMLNLIPYHWFKLMNTAIILWLHFSHYTSTLLLLDLYFLLHFLLFFVNFDFFMWGWGFSFLIVDNWYLCSMYFNCFRWFGWCLVDVFFTILRN